MGANNPTKAIAKQGTPITIAVVQTPKAAISHQRPLPFDRIPRRRCRMKTIPSSPNSIGAPTLARKQFPQ